jgi:hypothetical protein
MSLVGKNISELAGFRFEEYDNNTGVLTIKTLRDENYISKYKFVVESKGLLSLEYVEPEVEDSFSFTPFKIPEGTKKIYFSFKCIQRSVLGGFVFEIIQLKGNFLEYMNDNNSLETWIDNEVKRDYSYVPFSFETTMQKIEKEIEIHHEATEIFIMARPAYAELDYYVYDPVPINLENLFYKNNSLVPSMYSVLPLVVIFETPETTYLLKKGIYTKKRLTYTYSETVPEVPEVEDLDDYDFSHVWVPSIDIYDEEENLLYEKDKVYVMKTTINYLTEPYVVVNGWVKHNTLTKEDLDNGYEYYFLSGFTTIREILAGLPSYVIAYEGTFEFGDLMISTVGYDWAPAEGEINVDSNYKINREGMFIENNEEGYRREVTANRDISVNMQTGETIWRLTKNGQWVKTLEAKEIRMGNYHIVEENDELNIYYRGGA